MLNPQDFADRQIRAVIREYRELSRRRYTVVKLDKPIQRGWRRFYVIAEHATSRRDCPVLKAILRVIGSVVICKNPDFRQRRERRKKLVEIQQPLRPIFGHIWDRRILPDELLSYFRRELRLEWNGHWQPYWVFRQPSLFELRIERNWLRYFDEVDPAIETRLSELERWLTARCGRQRYDWLKGRSRHWIVEETTKQRGLKRLHDQEITRAYRNFPEVEPAASVRRCRFSFRRPTSRFPGVVQRAETLRSGRSQCGCPFRRASLAQGPELVEGQLLPPGPLFARPFPNQKGRSLS